MYIENSEIKAGKRFRKVLYINGKKHLAKFLCETVQSWKKISKQDQKYPHSKEDR